MAIEVIEIEYNLKEFFPDAIFTIKDLVGDKDHYSLEITSEQFRGKSLVEQHKLVATALKSCLGTRLHALQLKTKIPNS